MSGISSISTSPMARNSPLKSVAVAQQPRIGEGPAIGEFGEGERQQRATRKLGEVGLRVRSSLDRNADRRISRRQSFALGEPALQRNHDRLALRRGRIVREKRPLVLGKTLAPPKDHQMSAPASSTPTWMPHSTLPRPRQRPARSSSPGLTGLVHGRQPIEGKPLATKGWRGSPASEM